MLFHLCPRARLPGKRVWLLQKTIGKTQQESEKLLQCFGGFLGSFLKHPVPGVLQHDDGNVCCNQLGLLPSASPSDLSPPMVSTGMVSLVWES